MKTRRGEGSIFRFRNRGPYWIQFYRNGVKVRESSHSENENVAVKLLQKRQAEVRTDTFIEPRDRKLTVDWLYAGYLSNLRNNGMASLVCAEQRWTLAGGEPGRLRKFFGGTRALGVTSDRLNQYVRACQDEGLSSGTINRDLAALRRAFNIARREGRLDKIPYFPHLKESAPRVGFVEEPDYNKLATHAGELWLRALLASAYTFGFRKGELLGLRVRQADLFGRTIRLNAGETKSGDGRTVKMTGDVFTLLAACCAGKNPDDFVFTRDNGKPVVGFRKRWAALCKAAGLPGLLFHDLRRSAVRNAVRRGVPEVVCMRISGHKTRSVFDRYNVVSENDLADAAVKIEAGQVRAENGQNWDKIETPVFRSNPVNLEN